MAHSTSHPPAKHFDEIDPHGAGSHGQHGSHVIVGPFQLRLVLVVLLGFTILTVGFAQFEVWLEGLIGMTLPWWVNVVGAMSIAVVKSLLVMAIFMQLRYDNPINSIIMAVTFAALACFLGFTGLDLFNRGRVDAYKAPPIVMGGDGKQVRNTGDKPIVEAARERFMNKLKKEYGDAGAAAKFEEIRSNVVHTHHVESENVTISTPNRTRSRAGLSGALSLTPPAGAHGGHGAESHGEHTTPAEHAAPEHAQPANTSPAGHDAPVNKPAPGGH